MSLTYKDLIATTGVAAAMVVTYATLKGYNWPLVSSYKSATLAVLVLGIGVCILVGSNIDSLTGTTYNPFAGGWMVAVTILGSVSLLLAIINAVANNKTLFVIFSGTVLGLWLLTTTHHLVSKGA